jgi:hypothetical protein
VGKKMKKKNQEGIKKEEAKIIYRSSSRAGL